MHSLFIHSTKIKKYIEVVAKEAGQKLNFRRKCGRFSTIKRRISIFLRIDTMRFSVLNQSQSYQYQGGADLV